MADPYRVLVTGSRTWTDQGVIWDALTELLREHRDLVVVHGACPSGADAFAARWVLDTYRHVTAEPHPADWERHGKAAGFRRNAEMVHLGADVCLAFIRDGSPGATQCAAIAESKGIPVRRFMVDTASIQTRPGEV